MARTFFEAIASLAELVGVDAPEAMADEHARWALYQQALDERALRNQVLTVLHDDPEPTLVSAVVLRALGLVTAADRGDWLEVLPLGPQHDYAQRRSIELEVLERLAGDVDSHVDSASVRTWSDWLQLRMSERAIGRQMLVLLSEEGNTKRIRNRARERLTSL